MMMLFAPRNMTSGGLDEAYRKNF